MQQELHTQTYIAYAVGIVSKFNAAPTQAHLTAVKRIFRYLKGTIELKLQYRPDGENLLGYSDADWANDMDDRRSTTGNVFTMSGGASSCLSQKTNNSCAFYSRSRVYCFGSATQEAIWLYQLLNDLKIDIKGSIEIMEDNQRTITMVKSSVGHKRTKHIDIKHFLEKLC